jgi:hypothetical protein
MSLFEKKGLKMFTHKCVQRLFICLMVFNANFNNISVISWPVADKLYHIMLYTSPWSSFILTSVMIGTDCIDSCAKTQRYKYFYSMQTQGIKIQRYKKYWIMLENTKKILQIQTVEQWHRKKWNVSTLIMNKSKNNFNLSENYQFFFCNLHFININVNNNKQKVK